MVFLWFFLSPGHPKVVGPLRGETPAAPGGFGHLPGALDADPGGARGESVGKSWENDRKMLGKLENHGTMLGKLENDGNIMGKLWE